jgi:hypothetical protein
MTLSPSAQAPTLPADSRDAPTLAWRRVVFFAVVGAVVGTALDALHVLTGVLAYPHPTLGLQDWWVPALFASAGIALCEGHRRVAVVLAGRTPPWASTRDTAACVLLLVAVYGSSGLLKAWAHTAALLYVALFAMAWRLTAQQARRALMIHAAGAAVMGPLVEILISKAGGFHYLVPDVAGIPIWLPPLYMNAAVAGAALDRWCWPRAS